MKVDRGHQRFRVVEVDTRTGESRNLVDERTDTFIWTAHTENLRLDYVNWLEKTVPDFKLDAGQKAKLAEAIKAAKEKLAKVDAASVDIKGPDAIRELHQFLMNDLLTDAQRKQFMQFLGKTRPPGQGGTSQPAGMI